MSPWHPPGRRENHEENDCLCAAHPHYNYDRCSRCNGTRRASGTNYMSSCATCNPPHTHNYSGRNCTYGGQCSCGQAGTPLGHSYTGSATYSDESHPHAQYKFCARTNCWYKNYLGTNATKNHGSGATGSGTCPDCGSCTSFTTPQYSDTHPHNGTKDCVDCGETHSAGTTTKPGCATCNPPHTHNYSGTVQYKSAHPHMGYRTCSYSGCASTQDTGTNATPSWNVGPSNPIHDHVRTDTCNVKSGCTVTKQVEYSGKYLGCRTCFPPYTGHTVSLLVMADQSYHDAWGVTATTRAMHDAFSIETPFNWAFGISFDRSYESLLPIPMDDCTTSGTSLCDSSVCGSDYSDCSDDHTNASRNLDYIIHQSYGYGYDLNLTLVGKDICLVDHGIIHGLASARYGNSAIASDASANNANNIHRVRIMQHELSHLFGCRDQVCSGDRPCVMNGGTDRLPLDLQVIWCTTCYNDFSAYTH